MIRLGRHNWENFEDGIRKEWLLTNGLGGFASGTVIGANSRKYHGLLFAALRPPGQRTLFLSQLAEEMTIDGSHYPLYTSQWYSGDQKVVNPKGYLYLESFYLDPFPNWVYNLGDFKLHKTVFMVHGHNATVIRYKLALPPRMLPPRVLRPRAQHSQAFASQRNIVEPQDDEGATEKRGKTLQQNGPSAMKAPANNGDRSNDPTRHNQPNDPAQESPGGAAPLDRRPAWRFKIFFLANFRDYHSLTREGPWPFRIQPFSTDPSAMDLLVMDRNHFSLTEKGLRTYRQETDEVGLLEENTWQKVVFRAWPEAPPLYLGLECGKFSPTGIWWRNMNYCYEEEYRGESHTEDHLEIGYLEISEEDLLPASRTGYRLGSGVDSGEEKVGITRRPRAETAKPKKPPFPEETGGLVGRTTAESSVESGRVAGKTVDEDEWASGNNTLPGLEFSWTIVAATEPPIGFLDPKNGALLEKEARQRMDDLWTRFKQKDKHQRSPEEEDFVRSLVWAADSFIVQRQSTGTKSVIAGYPWFTDWGRDTMIALPGLTLVTGRFEIAREILLTFARYCRDGLLPNLFPDQGEEPLYNTIDASLWYFHAVHQYLAKTGDFDFIWREIYPVLVRIIRAHLTGTRFNIRVDPKDGLLSGGSRGLQLTWMDAKIGDWVVTPRQGKPVEVNALWYNALRVMEDLTNRALAKADNCGRVLEDTPNQIAEKPLSQKAKEFPNRSLRFAKAADEALSKITTNVPGDVPDAGAETVADPAAEYGARAKTRGDEAVGYGALGAPPGDHTVGYGALAEMPGVDTVDNDAPAETPGVDPVDYGALAEKVRLSFDKFWYAEGGYLYDVITEEGPDPSFRPNQIIVVSLPYSPLSPARARQVVEKVWQHLYTTYGLRSLAPGHPAYQGTYGGDRRSRDAAYHQGTVWAWLLGPFVTAFCRVHGRSEASHRQARRFLEPFREHLRDAGLGTISEIFSGDPPHRAAGCIAQAWSVAEILRAWVEEVEG